MIRYQFVDQSIKLADIHPDSIFSKEQKLAFEFVSALPKKTDIEPCPLCFEPRHEILFEKWGQRYALCPKTWTVSLADLPSEKSLQDYFHDSELAKFRASAEYQAEATKLRQALWNLQNEWMEGRVRRHLGMKRYLLGDFGSRTRGWVKTLEGVPFAEKLFVLDPLPPLTENASRPGPLPETLDVISVLDVIQRQRDPHAFMRRVTSLLRPGGLLILTCRTGTGFDLLTLRDQCESIYPIDHVFLPSPEGVKILLEKSGLNVLELTTPGLLDAQIVKHAGKALPKDQYFQRYLMNQTDTSTLERLQAFLQQNHLSSHLRVVAQKPIPGDTA